jgi:acetyltransferase-like isoleucine patch superfamily enzyme
LESESATWYYAAPTMHLMILAEGKRRAEERVLAGAAFGAGAAFKIRLVANAAGGLLPSLAEELKVCFPKSVVLPSYGMTECMPISTPPLTYNLERPGTSGIAVGPEIGIIDDRGIFLPSGEVGNIVVRGPPLMPGYENNSKANKESFSDDGWFNTGDKGYLDSEGYIYLTGRSKEVINRGGEIISPFDVEEALITHPRVQDVIAISMPHAVLQETVGVVVVTAPGLARPDLPSLHAHVSSTLHPAKWPQAIVYMKEVPKNSTGKTLRINLASRLSLPELSDTMAPQARLWEVADKDTPVKGVPISEPIRCRPAASPLPPELLDLISSRLLSHELVLDVALSSKDFGNHEKVKAVLGLAPGAKLEDTDHVSFEAAMKAWLMATDCGPLHNYALPTFYEFVILDSPESRIPRLEDGTTVDNMALALLPRPATAPSATSVKSEKLSITQKKVATVFSEVLELDKNSVTPKSDFFSLGGDSLKAGLLNALIRRNFPGVVLPFGAVFNCRTVDALAQLIDLQGIEQEDSEDHSDEEGEDTSSFFGEGEEEGPTKSGGGGLSFDHLPTRQPSSTSWPVLLIQLIPLGIMYPAFRVTQWFVFMAGLLVAKDLQIRYIIDQDGTFLDEKGFFVLVFQFAFGILMAQAFHFFGMPFIGIAAKWILVGRFRRGRYPLWGPDYLRWFLCKKALMICGRGIFLTCNTFHCWYYRLLGAHIGTGTKLSQTVTISEYDLVDIGDNCMIENCVIRPFCLETGYMVLDSIVIGSNCSVGYRTVCAPGTRLADNSVLGPLSSSHEWKDFLDLEIAKACAEVNRVSFTAPSLPVQFFFGYPLKWLIKLIVALPWFASVAPLILVPWLIVSGDLEARENLGAYLNWFANEMRATMYFGVRMIQSVFCPLLFLLCAIGCKRFILGKFKPGVWTSDWRDKFRYWFLRDLLSGRDFGGAAAIIGTHYQLMSWVMRAFGATVGDHVYWPGSGVDVVEFDLLTVEDDVVFGSRSAVMCATATTAAPVHIGAGAMVADRCLVLPGVTVGKNSVLGSGCLTQRNTFYKAGSIQLGSSKAAPVLWDEGNEKVAEKQSTLSPFAKAFYLGEASFFVLPLVFHILLNVVVVSLAAAFWVGPLLVSVRLVVLVEKTWLGETYEWGQAFGLMLLFFSGASLVFSLLAVLICISAKWALLGRRKAGNYNWNTSSYCQRWQIYLVIEKFRQQAMGGQGILDFLTGSAWLVWYFRALGCTIGKEVCLYPNGGDPMMTEPDLVTLGDHVGVDDASLIAHINSKGQFSLNRLSVGSRSTLRTGSRLLSGASMEADSTLLEHTLILSGEVVERGTIWQGWPGRIVGQARI